MVQVINLKCQMTQAGSFRPRDPGRRIGKRKKLYDIIPVKRKVEFVGLTLFAESFTDDLKAENIGIK
jgi:hypothetical protein